MPRMSSLASSNFDVSGTMAICMSPIVLEITSPTGPESSEALKKTPEAGNTITKKRYFRELTMINPRLVRNTGFQAGGFRPTKEKGASHNTPQTASMPQRSRREPCRQRCTHLKPHKVNRSTELRCNGSSRDLTQSQTPKESVRGTLQKDSHLQKQN